MPLGKIFTLSRVEEIILSQGGDELRKVPQEFVRDYIHLAVNTTAENINAGHHPDYATSAVVTVGDSDDNIADALSSLRGVYSGGFVTTTTAHGVVVGSLISIVSESSGMSMIAHVTEVVNSTKFAASRYGALADGESVVILVYNTSPTEEVDLSSLYVDQIINLYDSENGECIPLKMSDFNGMSGNITYGKNNIYYAKFGEKLLVKKGENVDSYGVMTLRYYRHPQKAATGSSYLDIRDVYIPHVISRARMYLFEHLGIVPPEGLKQQVMQDEKIEANNEMREKLAVEAEESNVTT